MNNIYHLIMNFKLKYIKYKKKYLTLKEKIHGGYILSKEEDFPVLCLDSKNDSVYMPEICGEDYPCLTADKKCYKEEPLNIQVEEENIKYIDNFFSEIYEQDEVVQTGVPIIIRLNSEQEIQFNYSNILKPKLIIDKKYIGSGGFGEVFSLFDINLNNIDFVLKLYTKGFDLYNFIETSKIHAELSTKNRFISKVYDFGTYQIMRNGIALPNNDFYIKKGKLIYDPDYSRNIDLFFILLEKCKGRNLFNLISENIIPVSKNIIPEFSRTLFFESQGIEMFKKICIQIFLAIKTIHDNGYIHGDIKLENFCFKDEITSLTINPIPEIRLIDFDFAKKIDSESGDNQGTTRYVSKKIKSASNSNKIRVNEKDDIFALGILIFAMLFGNFPYKKFQANRYFENSMSQLMNKYPDLYDLLSNAISIEEEDRNVTIDDFLNNKFFNI